MEMHNIISAISIAIHKFESGAFEAK